MNGQIYVKTSIVPNIKKFTRSIFVSISNRYSIDTFFCEDPLIHLFTTWAELRAG